MPVTINANMNACHGVFGKRRRIIVMNTMQNKRLLAVDSCSTPRIIRHFLNKNGTAAGGSNICGMMACNFRSSRAALSVLRKYWSERARTRSATNICVNTPISIKAMKESISKCRARCGFKNVELVGSTEFGERRWGKVHRQPVRPAWRRRCKANGHLPRCNACHRGKQKRPPPPCHVERRKVLSHRKFILS